MRVLSFFLQMIYKLTKYIVLIAFFVFLSGGQLYSQESKIKFNSSITRALRYAFKADKFIFAYIHTDWSVPCRQMEESTFNDSFLIKELNNDFINLSVNFRRNSKFAKEYEVHVFPTFMIIDKLGNAIIRDVGFKTPSEIVRHLNKVRNPNRYLRQNLDSLVLTLHRNNIMETIDSISYYKDLYTAKNLIKKYLDASKDWSDSIHMLLIKDNFTLDKKYLRYLSRNYMKFESLFNDTLSIKENIAFHVYINSLKTNIKGRPVFNFKPVKRWFKRHKIPDVEKMEAFVKIKYLLWGRGPSIKYSVNLLHNYPETTDENVLFASVIRLLISTTRRTLDYDGMIKSLRSTLGEDASYWRYDVLSLLYYKTGEDRKASEAISKAKARAELIGADYTPTLPLIKESIER